MRKHKVTREDKAEARVAEAIRAGVVLHWSAGHEDGTVGPNRDAVPSAKRQFALHSYKSGYRGQTESRFYETAEQAAYGMLVRTGVTNAIAALKKAAAKRDLRYSNLDTPIPWGRGVRLNPSRALRRNGLTVSAERVALWRELEAEYNKLRAAGLKDAADDIYHRFIRFGNDLHFDVASLQSGIREAKSALEMYEWLSGRMPNPRRRRKRS